MLNSGGSLLIGSGDKKKFYTAAATAAKNGRRLLARCPCGHSCDTVRDTPAFQPFHWALMSNDSPTWVDVKITSAQLDEEQLDMG